jgi:hypothetical protein
MLENIEGLCVPALIYLIYGATRVIIDTYKGMYNLAFMQIWITILFTYLLNVLCRGGLGIISWIIIAIPFLLMSIIAAVLLMSFGLDPSTGKAVYMPQAGQPGPPGQQHAVSAVANAAGVTQQIAVNPAQGTPTMMPETPRLPLTQPAQHANPVSVKIESFQGILGDGPRPYFY